METIYVIYYMEFGSNLKEEIYKSDSKEDAERYFDGCTDGYYELYKYSGKLIKNKAVLKEVSD